MLGEPSLQGRPGGCLGSGYRTPEVALALVEALGNCSAGSEAMFLMSRQALRKPAQAQVSEATGKPSPRVSR